MRAVTSIAFALLALSACGREHARSKRAAVTEAGAPSACASAAITGDGARALERALAEAVAKNRGSGGGVMRVESAACGVLWEGASGMRSDDTFEIASVTKTFTAALALLFAEEGRLDIDAPIGRLLPSEITERLVVVRRHDYGTELTVRQLLGHTSGLPDVWSDPPFVRGRTNAFVRDFMADERRFWTAESVISYAKQLKPIAEPGQRYHYSDTGYLLVGMILERVGEKPLHELLRDRIFTPLGMTDTTMSYREPPAAGRTESHRFEEALDLHGQRRQSADWASGGLVSSTRDLARFALALTQGKLLRNKPSLDAMTSFRPTGAKDVEYGLGVFRVRLENGRGALIGHDGHGNAFAYVWPERGIAFVGTLNQTKNDWWPLVSAAVARVSE